MRGSLFGLLVLILCLLSVSLAKVIRYEAEDAHLVGAVTSSNGNSGHSGQRYVNFDHAETGTIIFSVNIPKDGLYPFTLRYAVKDGYYGPVSIFINGHDQGMLKLLDMAQTGSWFVRTEHIPFRFGLNTIMIKRVPVEGLTSAVKIDYVELEGAVPLAQRGATLSYFEIEAEDAMFTGTKIGPSRQLYVLPTEASGRYAVQITGSQYVEFTLTGSANGITVRYSIPDTPNGSGQVSSLNILVNGQQATNLTVTSIHSWAYGDYPFTKNPGDGKQHHFYDEARAKFGKTLPAGTKVRIVPGGNLVYTIDLADFYTIPEPYPMPAGFLSVTDSGADPSGKSDSTAAFTKAIGTAQAQGKGLWIPQGWFLVTTRFTVNKIVIRGAGPWWSTVQGTVDHGVGFFGGFVPNPSSDVQLYDFAILGDTNVRDDAAPDSGVGGAFNGNSVVQNLWIEHTKCGMWLDGPFSGLHIAGVTIRNTYADGINLHMGISNVVIEQSILRNLGDDGLAIWSEHQSDVNNTFKFNTVQVPLLANGIAFYGGQDNTATDNYVADSICDGGGLQIGNRYQAVPVSGTTVFARTTVYRGGAPSRFSDEQECGAIWMFQEQGSFTGHVLLQDIDLYNSSYAGITFWDSAYSGTLTISNINVHGGPYVMEVSSASGTVPCDHVVATDLTTDNGGVHSCGLLIFQDAGGNSGWDLNHDHQHCP